MDIQINSQVSQLKESSTLAINQRAKNLLEQGKKIFHLGFGQSPFPVPPKVKEKLEAHSKHKEYLPTQGLLELREAISDFYSNNYGYELKAENIMIGPGSKELIFQAIYALEGPLIIAAPSWVSYGPQAFLRSKELERIQCKIQNKYKLTAQELKEKCIEINNKNDDKNIQKILIINSPNNPTGSMYEINEMKSLVEVCREFNVIIISDEIYSMVNFDMDHNSFINFYPEGTIVTNGISKWPSAGGYRLGFLAVSDKLKNLIKAMSGMASETFSAVSSPIQYAGIECFRPSADTKKYIEICTNIHHAASIYLYKRFIEMNLNCAKPNGAFYLYPDFENYKEKLKNINILDSINLSNHLLNNYGIACLASSEFYQDKSYLAIRVASVDYDGEMVFANACGRTLDNEFIENNCPNLKLACDSLEMFLASL